MCGTDIALFSGDYTVPLPLVLGHELVGEVVEVGSDDNDPWIGKRVTAEINNTCRAYNREAFCAACRRGLSNHCIERTVVGIINYDGAYAQYVRVPILNLHSLPDTISWEGGRFRRTACGSHSDIRVDADFSVKPSCGARHRQIGIADLCGRLLQEGAGMRRFPVAGQARSCVFAWGAVETIDANQPNWIEAAREWTGGIGADVVVDATGNPEGLRLAAEIVRPRGTIALKTTCGLPATRH